MNPEKQRIAIAKIEGWKGRPHPERPRLMIWMSPGGKTFCYAEPPDYLNDLNAMHKVEQAVLLAKGTDYSRWEEYDNRLFDLCGGFARAHATAAQRAEAFLRTIGKWEESK